MTTNGKYAAAWEKYRRYALTSRRLKSEWERLQTAFLWMSLMGTIVAAIGTYSTGFVSPLLAKLAAVSGAILLGVGGYLSKDFFAPDKDLAWIKARAIAEAIKSDVFRFAAGVPLENGKSSEEDLWESVKRMEEEFQEDLAKGDGKQAPERGMTLEKYVQARLKDQEAFYGDAKIRALKSAGWFKHLRRGFGVAIVGLGCTAAFAESVNALIVLFSAIAAIISTYAATTRYEFLWKSYAALERRMRDLIVEAADAKQHEVFIAQCESELTAEHRTWLAGWKKSQEPATAASSAA